MEDPRDTEPREGEIVVPEVAPPPVSHTQVPVAPGKTKLVAGGLAAGMAAYVLLRLLRR